MTFSYEGIIKILIIKLTIATIVSYIVKSNEYELYNVREKKFKIILVFTLILLSFASEPSPFLNYGKTNKPDCKKNRKISSQSSLLIIRLFLFIESLLLFSSILFSSGYISLS